MLNQNYLKVFENGCGTITIASGHGEPEDFQNLEIQTITICREDLLTLSDALESLNNKIEEEASND